MNINIADINCSTTPSSNDWVKLGMSKSDSELVSPIMCPKTVQKILTGDEILKVMRDCKEERVTDGIFIISANKFGEICYLHTYGSVKLDDDFVSE